MVGQNFRWHIFKVRHLLATLPLLLLLPSCKKTPLESTPVRIEAERPLMGTLFKVVTYSTDRPTALLVIDQAFAKAEHLSTLATDYDPDSELNQLSDSPTGVPVAVSKPLFDLLERAKNIAILTQGAYDPTLGSMTQLWRETSRSRTLPDPETLEKARTASGYSALLLDPIASTATLTKPHLRLDLGGIAKGYAADLIHDHLAASGLPQTLVAAGGDLRLGDPPPEKEGWQVALRTFALTPTGTLTLKNCAISTSGDLHQRVIIDRIKYSHIIDPMTGLGFAEQKAASVIAPTATLTDPLATAACVHPDPAKLLEKFPQASFRILVEDQTERPVKSGLFLRN